MSSAKRNLVLAQRASEALKKEGFDEGQRKEETSEQHLLDEGTFSKRGSSATPSAASERLMQVKGHLTGIGAKIQQGLERKGMELVDAVNKAKDNMLRLEQHLAVETRRRTEADQALTTAADEYFGKIASAFDTNLDKRLKTLAVAVEAVTSKVMEMEEEVIVQRTQQEALLEELRSAATTSQADVQNEVDVERSERMEKEIEMITKIKKEIGQLQERVMLESQSRERVGATLREDVTRAAKFSGKANEDQMRSSLFDDIQHLKKALRAEAEARQASEEAFADTMNLMVTKVQQKLMTLKPK